MRFKRFGILVVALAATSVCILGANGGCGSSLHKAAVAADSIGNSLNTAASVNHQLVASGQETVAEGAQVASYIDAAAKANDAFIAQISSAEANGSQVTSATIVTAFGALVTTVQSLQSQGVLGLKSTAAQQQFQTITAAINAQLAVLQALIQTSTAQNRPGPLRHSAPLLGIALTAEEIETLIDLVTTALGAGVPLVEKLLAMKGETDSALLSDAQSQDKAAETEAEADEAKA